MQYVIGLFQLWFCEKYVLNKVHAVLRNVDEGNLVLFLKKRSLIFAC
jgi:hypothetical protein